MTHYVAIIHKDSDSDYGVSFPDFPGAASAGKSPDAALVNAEAALALHIAGLREDGESIPEPSSLAAVMADPNNAGGVAALVRAS